MMRNFSDDEGSLWWTFYRASTTESTESRVTSLMTQAEQDGTTASVDGSKPPTSGERRVMNAPLRVLRCPSESKNSPKFSFSEQRFAPLRATLGRANNIAFIGSNLCRGDELTSSRAGLRAGARKQRTQCGCASKGFS